MSVPVILLIEDNWADVYLIREALDRQATPYRMEVLADGEAALNFVGKHRSGAHPHDPCVILLDVNLPKYNGVEVLAAIRQEPVLTHIHVVALSIDFSPADHADLTALGAICRKKPSDLDAHAILAAEILELCKSNPNLSTLV